MYFNKKADRRVLWILKVLFWTEIETHFPMKLKLYSVDAEERKCVG